MFSQGAYYGKIYNAAVARSIDACILPQELRACYPDKGEEQPTISVGLVNYLTALSNVSVKRNP